MKTGARLAAAVEILDDMAAHHRTAQLALADWGKSHRFAGSGDRAAIGTLVYDVLRRKQSLAAKMQSEASRALVLAAASRAYGITGEAVGALADGSEHALAPLSADEQAGLSRELAADTPAHICGDYPEWLQASFDRAFGASASAEGAALAMRAPVDLRVNSLKADREKVLKALAHFGAVATPISPLGVRIAAPEGAGKAPHVEAEAAHGKGWFEVQDEGSQIAAAIAAAGPRQQVLDLCAGSGGKTLAMAAAMQNTGQINAYDRDKSQLRPIFERLKRAGVRNVQTMTAGDEAGLRREGARFDLVLVDAPCTGSGTWRRKPDAKWRLKPQNLAQRQDEQRAVLELAARLVKPGGRLVYVTCSVLPEENQDQIDAFITAHPQYSKLPVTMEGLLASAGPVTLTPHQNGTDGFFVAPLLKSK
ncbi:MAG: RsmB/NOP family class I SAM-dependent RNA methyltransferase [Hyphomicrobiaceae bacterium]|nr:RsmB/NOP family class I SAM-dependent RNA methyltransferase [Hyphomicrobiaceae bacterium]